MTTPIFWGIQIKFDLKMNVKVCAAITFVGLVKKSEKFINKNAHRSHFIKSKKYSVILLQKCSIFLENS